MPDSAKPAETAAPAVVPPRRHPGHRGQDVRDTVAEMAAKAHEISLEAGSKMAAAMKEVVGAAAGLVAFSIESARDLVQYMVRRGQMTQEEADKLVREAEEAYMRKHKGKLPPRAGISAKPAASKPASKPAAKAAGKPAAKKASKSAGKKAPAKKKPAAKKPAAKK
jgi:hypothetical protein